MLNIDDELIAYVAELGKLELSDTQKQQLKVDFENILGYMSILDTLDTENVAPLSHTFPITNVFRDDVVYNELTRDELLANAPQKKDGCFKVPKTVD